MSCSVFAPFYHGKPVMDELSIENLFVCVCSFGFPSGVGRKHFFMKTLLGPSFPMPRLPTADLLSETNNAAGLYRVRAMGSLSRNAKHPETNPEV